MNTKQISKCFLIGLFSIILPCKYVYPQSAQKFLNLVHAKNIEQVYSNLNHNYKRINKQTFPNNLNILKKMISNSNNESLALIDSMVSVLYDTSAQKIKSTYEYNQDKKLSNYMVKTYNNGSVKSGESYTFAYSNGKLSSTIVYSLVNNAWQASTKMTNNFDPNGNNVLTENEKWDVSASSWVGVERDSRTYDANNNKLSEINEAWDADNSIWVKVFFTENTFTANNLKATSVLKVWFGDNWQNFTKNSFLYNADSKVAEIIQFNWNFIDNVWVNSEDDLYTYNGSGLETTYLRKQWFNNDWQDTIKITKDYNGIDLLTYNLTENWNGSTWIKDNDFTIAYNEIGLPLSYTAMNKWNGSNWGGGDRLLYSYNSNNLCDNIVHESWFENHWISADGVMWVPEIVSYDPDIVLYYFTNGYQADIFYPEATGLAEDNNSIPKKISLSQNYPNPFNPTTTINYQIPAIIIRNGLSVQLKVYDVLGKEVATLVNTQQTAGNYSVNFNASNLSSGIYYYKIEVGTFTYVRKMLLLK